jgi:hypothetical protein
VIFGLIALSLGLILDLYHHAEGGQQKIGQGVE